MSELKAVAQYYRSCPLNGYEQTTQLHNLTMDPMRIKVFRI